MLKVRSIEIILMVVSGSCRKPEIYWNNACVGLEMNDDHVDNALWIKLL